MSKANKTYKKIFPYFTKLSFDELKYFDCILE